jgi:hypothetical protein
MLKKAKCIAALFTLIMFSIHASAKKTHDVDAVTSASIEFKQISVTTYSATVIWEEWFPDQGTATISYGTDSTNLAEKRDITLDERNIDIKQLVITGLTGNTKYYIRLDATPSDPELDPYSADTTFTTLNPSKVIQELTISKNTPLELLDHSVRVGAQARSGDRLIIADCEGRTIFNHAVTGREGIITLPAVSKGVYFLTFQRQGKLLDNKRFIIMNK